MLLPGMYVTPQQLAASNDAFCNAIQRIDANITAIVALLISKGLITEEEWRSAYLQATSHVEQELAKSRDAREGSKS